MTERPTHDLQRHLTNRAVREARLSLANIWLRNVECAGAADEIELEAHLYGVLILTSVEGDILAHTVNELIDELPHHSLLPRAPSTHSLLRPLSD